MYILIAIPKSLSNKVPVKVTQDNSFAVIVAAKAKLEEAHAKYIKEAVNLKEPLSFLEYEGTVEEYELYCTKFREEAFKYSKSLSLSQPDFLGHDLYII